MRVVAGKHRSRILKEFKGEDIRPTTDRVKESLFNIIQNVVFGSSVLDLFCGTGNLGIEAISRGAKKVVFCDNSKDSVEITKANLKSLNEIAEVNFTDYTRYIKTTNEKFDLIFLDPPYETDLGENALKAIALQNVLNEDGVIVFESDKFLDKEIDGLELFDKRKYGYVHLNFYRNKK